MRTRIAFLGIAVSAALYAEIPPDVAKQLVNIGKGVCVPETAQIYGPMHPKPPYKGVTFTRDISFGPDAKDVLDLAVPEKGGGNRAGDPPTVEFDGGGDPGGRSDEPTARDE